MPTAAAVPSARHFVQERMAELGYRRFADDAALVASELVTNAVEETERHENIKLYDGKVPLEQILAEGTFAGWWRPWLVCVSVYAHRRQGAVIEVWDCSRIPPKPERETDSLKMTGRGLAIVEAVAKVWGYRFPRCGGKVVFALLQNNTREV
ncbi:ATP-binding protein [Nonomuraea sp. NPDC048892]|uniref:ATP-binding protein n=1 Tax=Nonomuraea sp. NPDC048892 TaxID=3154624 RepID=UPI0033E02CEC